MSNKSEKLTKDILEWKRVSGIMAENKHIEAELRRSIAERFSLDYGINHFDEYGISITSRSNISVIKKDFKAKYKNMSVYEKACFKFEPKLIKSAYNELKDRDTINDVIVQKDAMPSISLLLTGE